MGSEAAPQAGIDPHRAPTSDDEREAGDGLSSPDAGQDERVACRRAGCGSPSQFVGDSGWCRAHDPDLDEERRRASALGGARTALKWKEGIDPDELGPLAGPEDAARWAGVVAAAVAAGRISASAGNSIRQLIAEFRSAHDAAQLADEVRKLRKQLGRSVR